MLCLFLASCHPKPTKKQRFDDAIQVFNSQDIKLPEIKIIPEQYNEILTDTLLTSNFRIKIKNYSSTTDAIVVNETSENVEKHYRIISSDIIIYYKNVKSTETTIRASDIANHFAIDEFWNQANIQYSWVNQELSTANNVALNFTLYNPLLGQHRSITLTIDKNGNKRYFEATKLI